MSSIGESSSQHLRELILNTRKPLILRGFQTNWQCFSSGSLEEWCRKYDAGTTAAQSSFERISTYSSNSPQWERKRKTVQITAMQFLQDHSTNQEYWTGLNYKRASELPAECVVGLDFSCFGFAQAADDCTYWLSSEKSNTPCHFDSYGCNIVVQVYGKKSWLLFPPDAPLTSTRIPYEESSVYCLQNFYAPDVKDIENYLGLHKYALKCTLEPKDVLIVPRHWWHYVETLETSLSVNCWVPLEVDAEAQLEECIVKFLVESFVKNTNEAVTKYVLNPNQVHQLAEDSEIFAVLKYLYNSIVLKGCEGSGGKIKQNKFAYQYLSETQLENLMQQFPEVEQAAQIAHDQFKELIMESGKRLNSQNLENEPSPLKPIQQILINSICSPQVVKCIKNEFFKRYKN